MAALLRFSLDSGQAGLVSLYQEMKIVRDYLDIERARFDERLRFAVEIPSDLDGLEVPPLSIQTLVENSVCHRSTSRRRGHPRVGGSDGQGSGPQSLGRLGERVEFIELDRSTHLFAKDKLTYAATAAKDHCVDWTISELEAKLDPKKFVRIHRSTIVNASYVPDLYSWFAGRMLLRLKDEKKAELTVARDRVKALKEHLGI